MIALSMLAAIIALLVAAASITISYVQSTVWWAGYDLRNCLGCKSVIDWSDEEQSNTVTSQLVRTFERDGVVVLPSAISSSKVADLATEVESMSDTFMTSVLTKVILRQYSKYEHRLDTRSEIIRDWAVHGPLAKWAAELMNVKEARLYNAEKIYSAGEDNPMGCSTGWHRDTVAAPFNTKMKSVTINIYLDDIGADGPNGDALIYVKGSHHNLESPPDVTTNLFEPNLVIGDVLAHGPHIYHTPSGRGCWNRRSLQFRYVESPTTFEFAPNRFPQGPIPWTLAHAPGVAPHGLIPGESALAGPWYPKVYPAPLESEHVPLDGKAWSVLGLLGVSKQSQDIAGELGIGNFDDCTIDNATSSRDGGNYAYYGFDGPVMNCKDWDMSSGIPLHKDGQMILNLQPKDDN